MKKQSTPELIYSWQVCFLPVVNIHLIFLYSDYLQFMQGYLKNWAVFVMAYSILSPFQNLIRPLQNEETEEKKLF